MRRFEFHFSILISVYVSGVVFELLVLAWNILIYRHYDCNSQRTFIFASAATSSTIHTSTVVSVICILAIPT